MDVLNIKEIIQVSIATYKEKWKTLFLVSLLITIAPSISSMISVVSRSIEDTAISLLLGLVSIVLMTINMYIASRLSVTLIFASRAYLTNEDVSTPIVYRRAKSVTWRYIGYSMLLGLIVLIPMILVVIGIVYGAYLNLGWTMRVAFIILGGVSQIYLKTIYIFSPFIAIFYPHAPSVFGYSRKLVKNNFMKLLVITLISGLFTVTITLPYILLTRNQTSIFIVFSLVLIKAIITAVVAPFDALMNLEAMKRLEEVAE